ncbi:MAG: GatB/YqeY domain-containing protein [Bacillota bacterium]
MSLQDQLLEDMKSAMKNKNKEKVSVIRMARAAIKDAAINERKDLSDDEVVEVLAKLVKQNKESLVEFEKADRPETVEKLKREIEILEEYLPEQLSESELEELVEETIEEVGAEDMSAMGQVMGAIMPKIKGKADGSEVNKLVKEKLQ